jgi:hypothetical protein
VSGRLNVVLPSLRPAGGIVKCFDYVSHARSLGLEVSVYCDQPPEQATELRNGPDRFAEILETVPFRPRARLPSGPDELYFFSLPSDFRLIEPLLRRGIPTRNIIHIIQGTRHAEAAFQDGYALRLLTRPMSRIMINQRVLDAVGRFLNARSYSRVIPLAHDGSYFHGRREGPGAPLRVGYMTWKSDLGDRLARRLAGDARFAFHALRGPATWPELRRFYHGLDVLLCAPGPQEGFYLPGLEAMAAGCVVVIPDVGGNMAYCRFDENCLGYAWDDPASAAAALARVAAMGEAERERLLARADETWRAHDLDDERRLFGTFLEDLPSG